MKRCLLFGGDSRVLGMRNLYKVKILDTFGKEAC